VIFRAALTPVLAHLPNRKPAFQSIDTQLSTATSTLGFEESSGDEESSGSHGPLTENDSDAEEK